MVIDMVEYLENTVIGILYISRV